jgi:hypothetical protein
MYLKMWLTREAVKYFDCINHGGTEAQRKAFLFGSPCPCSASSELLRFLRRVSAIIAWPRMAGIADFRLPIAPPRRASRIDPMVAVRME